MCYSFILLLFFKDFIYLFDRERDGQQEREHKQGEWERQKQAFRWTGSPMWGLIPERWDHALSRRQMLNNSATQAPLNLRTIVFILNISMQRLFLFSEISVKCVHQLLWNGSTSRTGTVTKLFYRIQHNQLLISMTRLLVIICLKHYKVL